MPPGSPAASAALDFAPDAHAGPSALVGPGGYDMVRCALGSKPS